jgi:dihydrolipoamide dehydrogenase
MPSYDIAIVGGGPGGYVAAIRAAQVGLKTALIEEDRIGGLCLNWGCIPSKALLWNAELVHLFKGSDDFGITYDALHIDMGKAIDRSRTVVDRMVKGVEFLLKKNKVSVVNARASLKSAHEVALPGIGDLIESRHTIIATGARPRALPEIEIDGNTIMTSRQALELRDVPASIVIVGGGPVGCEFAYFYRAYGAEVTVVELLDHLLPMEDEAISRHLERAFKQQGIAYRTGARVNRVTKKDGLATVSISSNGEAEELTGERVLIGVGQQANTEGLGIESLGVVMERGNIAVGDDMQTNIPDVYAIGDVTGKLPLAHVASAQGVAAVESIAGLESPILSYEKMPRCTYCQPQVASLGLTEQQAKERGMDVKVGTFPYRGAGKAIAMERTEGMAKLVVDVKSREIVGYHVIGQDATELLAEASLGSVLEATPRELGWTVHAHPTLSEIVKEAALAVDGQAIHFWTE